jgi:hypothetical protein
MRVPAHYYQQFDADVKRDVPCEGYGWRNAEIELAPAHTAAVVMHAWETGTPEQYPGWYRCVDYLPRAQEIGREVFPPLLNALRAADWNLFHVVGCGSYYADLPGYQRAVKLAAPESALEQAAPDPVLENLRAFREAHSCVGTQNQKDVQRAFEKLDFLEAARPVGNEGVAENASQLFALCKAAGVNHLIYMGFAINWCLLLSPGGMGDMHRRGMMCSAFRQAVTAVENKETARGELGKENGLWRVGVQFGFVFDVPDFLDALAKQ